MTVNIGQSLRGGISLTLSRNGLILILVWAILGAGSLLFYNSWLAALYANLPGEPVLFGPSLDISPLYTGISSLIIYLISFVFMAGALRTFVNDERQTLRLGNFTHNLGWMLLNLIIGFIIFYVAVWIGFIFLIVPGLFLLVSLYFWYVLVVVDDDNFYEAFRNSWAITKGNRWTLLGIGLIVTVCGWILMAIPMAVSFALPDSAALVVVGISTAAYGVFALATTARVYVQLTRT